MRILLTAVFVLTASLAGCTGEDSGLTATLHTNMGDITVLLYDEHAPITVGNFAHLAQTGLYNDTKFHRIVSDFMMQGGDPNSKDDDPSDDGRGGPGYTIPDEIRPELRHDKGGLLSMANSGPDTGGSQFFITFKATPWLDDKHTIFGEVIDGMDVVRKVDEEASSLKPDGVPPRKTVVLESVTIHGNPPEFNPPAPRDSEMGDGIQADLITPGTWTITNTTDHVLWWIHNGDDAQTTVDLSFEGPDGWVFDAGGSSITLAPAATDQQGAGGRYTYPDWGYGVATVTVPDGTSGSFEGAFVIDGERFPLNFDVQSTDQAVSALGHSVTTDYRGYFTDSEEQFDQGQFPLSIGGGRAIPGFDLGLAGHAVGEDVTLVIPPALAYGYHASGRLADFNGQWLSFDIQLQESA